MSWIGMRKGRQLKKWTQIIGLLKNSTGHFFVMFNEKPTLICLKLYFSFHDSPYSLRQDFLWALSCSHHIHAAVGPIFC